MWNDKHQLENENGSELACSSEVVSYCCDISERKDILSVKHGLLVRKPCIACLVLMDDMRSLRMAR